MADTKGMTYIRMMLDVLNKKEVHLKKLLEFTLKQETLLKAEEFNEEEFTKQVEKKDGIIRKIEEFDSGFQSIFNRVEEEMKDHKEDYKEQILEMQRLISSITDLGVKLTALEAKNKTALEQKLKEKRQGIRTFKVSKQTADTYYKNMIGMWQLRLCLYWY